MSLELDVTGKRVPKVVISEQNMYSFGKYQMHEIKTDHGPMQVAVEGDLKKPCIFTLHDIGLNHETCWTNFFNCSDAAPELMINALTKVHIIIPGQQFDAPDLADDVTFDFQGMVDLIELVRSTLGVTKFFGMGVGCGAYLMLAYACQHNRHVAGLCLFGATSRALGWIEWGKSWQSWVEQKIWGTDFRYKSNFVERWLGWMAEGTLIHSQYMDHINRMNVDNVNKFLVGYHARLDITDQLKQIRCPLLFYVGDGTPYENEMVHVTRTIGPGGIFMDSIRCDAAGILLPEHKPHFVHPSLELFFKAMGFCPDTGGIKRW